MFNKKEYMKQYHIDNREKRLERTKKWAKDNPIKEKERVKKWNENNPEKVKVTQKNHHEKKRQYIQDYKLSKGCSICRYNKCAGALVFHHNGDKEFGVSQSFGRSLEKIWEEIEKCTILCMNCHAELHAKERLIDK